MSKFLLTFLVYLSPYKPSSLFFHLPFLLCPCMCSCCNLCSKDFLAWILSCDGLVFCYVVPLPKFCLATYGGLPQCLILTLGIFLLALILTAVHRLWLPIAWHWYLFILVIETQRNKSGTQDKYMGCHELQL